MVALACLINPRCESEVVDDENVLGDFLSDSSVNPSSDIFSGVNGVIGPAPGG